MNYALICLSCDSTINNHLWVKTMFTKEKLSELLENGPLILDGATGSNLQKAGMPRGCCTESWILEHPQALLDLQASYVQAGSRIIYAPTFQAQPIALKKLGLDQDTERINEKLVKLSRSVSDDVLVAGNLTTLAAFTDSFDESFFDLLVDNYRRQIRGLLAGGADLLAAETLMYPTEAEAILTAAELEGAETVFYTFTMQPDGSLFSGRDAAPILRDLEQSGAAAVGFNCVAADDMTPGLVSRLRRYVKGPLICKPNAGNPVIGADSLPHYPMKPQEFAAIMKDCRDMGAAILGGCCGTDPDFIRCMASIF